ncbi:hypothetical protein ACF1AJ_15885 [Leifsonia sp. NPDC014704]|uniref:hypothetical protein n=1 Tax=Leifsonia sp. NPDC014704 TaxID=3364123 RepID=UPI0036F4A6E3
MALVLMAVLLVGCSVQSVHRTDVIGLWKHPADTSQSVDIRQDGTFLIRNVSKGALSGKAPAASAPYTQIGTWQLERHRGSHRSYLLLLGVDGSDHSFISTFEIVGSGASLTIYLPLGGRYEGRRFEFTR